MKQDHMMSVEAAEALAAAALGHLAADEERLGRFLALSGIDPAEIRTAAAAPGFLPGVLEHVLSDEKLLLGFAAEAGIAPESVGRAHEALARAG